MLPFQGIVIFIEAAAVKFDEAVLVLAEMGRHPVQYHADAGAVEPIHQIHKVVGCPVTGCRGIITGTLIAPGGIIRILRHRQKFHIVIAVLPHIVCQLVAQFPVCKEPAVLAFAPRAQMHLVNIEKALRRMAVFHSLAPLVIRPVKTAYVVDFAVGQRPCLGVESIGISLPPLLSVRPGDQIFITIVLLDAGGKQRPAPFLIPLHKLWRPVVPVAGQFHLLRVRRPYAEKISFLSPFFRRVRPKQFIGVAACSAVKFLHILDHMLFPLFPAKKHTTAPVRFRSNPVPADIYRQPRRKYYPYCTVYFTAFLHNRQAYPASFL